MLNPQNGPLPFFYRGHETHNLKTRDYGLVCSYICSYENTFNAIDSRQWHLSEDCEAPCWSAWCGESYWDLWLWMCWGTSGCSKKLLYSCSKRGVRHDFFLENQRLLQRVKACQNTSTHVMLQHQLQNSEGNIPTYSNPLAAKWNSSMNPQSCWALVRHCKSGFKDLKLHRFHLEVSRSPVFHGHRMAQACHSSMSVRSPTFPRRPESFSGPGVKYIRMSCRELFQDITRVQGWQDMTRSTFVRWVTLT
jgi:hypothetical protein